MKASQKLMFIVCTSTNKGLQLTIKQNSSQTGRSPETCKDTTLKGRLVKFKSVFSFDFYWPDFTLVCDF